MAKEAKRKSSAISRAAAVTETSDAIALMAMELVAADPAGTDEQTIADEIAAAAQVEADAMALAFVTPTAEDIAFIESQTVTEDEVHVLEAIDDEAPVLEVQATEETAPNVRKFEELVAEITPEERLLAVHAMTKAIDERAEFERAQGNDNIQKNFIKARNAFCLPSAGAVLLACSVDEAFVNRSMHDGKRYNVYAMGKLADLTAALNGGTVNNRINFAIMRSLFAFKRAGIPFTGDMAKAAASDKIRIADKAITAILTRHTVSAVTAPTQASSTMQALETLGIVRREGSHKNPTFTLTDHPAVTKLEEVMAKAA